MKEKGGEIPIATMHKLLKSSWNEAEQNTERLWQRETKEKNPKLDDS